MNKAGRGWSHASQMKPAQKYDNSLRVGAAEKEVPGGHVT